MENSSDADHFASLITPNCLPTSSQEDKLQSCPFARESEFDLSLSMDEPSEQHTGIEMVSLPESSDDYQTPPEQQFYSQNSSNDGQVAATMAAAVNLEKESGGVQDGKLMVPGNDDDTYKVDLSNDSDDLRLLEKILFEDTKVLGDDNTLMGDVHDTNQIGQENMASEADAEISVREAPETHHKESADKVFVEMPMREQEASTSHTEVETNMASNRKRKLPFLMNRPKKDDTEKENPRDDFFDILNHALKILKREGEDDNGGDEDVDFLETAKRRGMIFPRPRWWPPEGELEFPDFDL